MQTLQTQIVPNSFFIEEVRTLKDKTFIADDVYELLKKAYATVKGGLHFTNSTELITSTALWQLVYHYETLVGVIIYKAKLGLKMVAMGINHMVNKKIKRHTKKFISYIFKKSFSKIWMEVSEAAESFMLKIGGDKFLVSNKYAVDLTKKDIKEYENDGYHYKREIQGIIKTKIIIGSPKNISKIPKNV
jgi:hypothetical protein